MHFNQVGTSQKSEKESEHYEEYNFANYIQELTDYVLRKRNMMLVSHTHVLDSFRQQVLDSKLDEAIKKKTVFSILGYYPSIRHKLETLGWIEKIDYRSIFDHYIKPKHQITHLESAPYIVKDETSQSYNTSISEGKYLSEELSKREVKVNLLISLKRNYISWQNLDRDTIVSNFPKCNFCSKFGLNQALSENTLFNTHDSLHYPQSYNLTDDIVYGKFTKEFRETSCFSLMRYIAQCAEKKKQYISHVKGNIPWASFYFAEKVCIESLRRMQQENVEDEAIGTRVSSQENNTGEENENLTPMPNEETEEVRKSWDKILEEIGNIVKGNAFYAYMNKDHVAQLHNKAQHIVRQSAELRSSDFYDGIHNIWVLKPVANCSGYGIRLHRNLDDIRRTIGTFKKNESRTSYVIQKYIERPMLILGVKFDLRVWFVVSYIHRLKIWVYQEGYVRFCSRPFNLDELDDARHLTNVRIQTKHRTSRSPPNLPTELMWDFQTLREYFVQELGMTRKWEVIMREMERAITTVMQCALMTKTIELRKNSFQLFGADFLIHENFDPCLIEMNSGPGLSPTTSIIAKKTTSLLTDMTKIVIVDKEPSSKPSFLNQTDVGGFKLVEDVECFYETSSFPAEVSRRLDASITGKIVKTRQVDIQNWKRTTKGMNMKQSGSKKPRNPKDS